MNPKKLIINREDLLQGHQKFTAMWITLFFWASLLYLWQPVISLVAWAFNIKIFYSHMVVLGGYKTFLDLLLTYAIVIAYLAGALILWAKVNEWRFRGVDRRTGLTDSDFHKVCETFDVAPDELEQWQGERRLIIDVDHQSHIHNVTIL